MAELKIASQKLANAQLEEALLHVDRAIAIDPKRSAAYRPLLIRVLIAKEDDVRALAEIDKALDDLQTYTKEPEWAMTAYDLAMEVNDTELAIRCLEQLAVPDYGRGIVKLRMPPPSDQNQKIAYGYFYASIGCDSTDVQFWRQKAVYRDPQNPYLRMYMSYDLVLRRRKAEALAAYDWLMAQNLTDPDLIRERDELKIALINAGMRLRDDWQQ